MGSQREREWKTPTLESILRWHASCVSHSHWNQFLSILSNVWVCTCNLFVCVSVKMRKVEKSHFKNEYIKTNERRGEMECSGIFLDFTLEIGWICEIHRMKLWTKLEMKNWPTKPSERLAKRRKEKGKKSNKMKRMANCTSVGCSMGQQSFYARTRIFSLLLSLPHSLSVCWLLKPNQSTI